MIALYLLSASLRQTKQLDIQAQYTNYAAHCRADYIMSGYASLMNFVSGNTLMAFCDFLLALWAL